MKKKDILKEISFIFWFILLLLFIKIFFIEISFVPTGSMQFSILPGDFILSTKHSYGYSNNSIPLEPQIFEFRIFSKLPNRGDIIILKLKNLNYKVIKRLIALPGEKIEIRDNVTYVNDVVIPRKFLKSFKGKDGIEYEEFKETLPNGLEFLSYNINDLNVVSNKRANFGPFYIPEGHYFFLGDNRDNSADSRSFLGFVPFESFVSKAQYIFISNKELLKQTSDSWLQFLKKIPSWFTGFRSERFFKSLYKQNISIKSEIETKISTENTIETEVDFLTS